MSFDILNRTFYFFAEKSQWDKLWKSLDELMNNPYCIAGVGLILLTVVLGFCIRKAEPGKKIIIFRINVILYVLGLCFIYLFREHAEGSGIRELGIQYYLTPGGFHESLVITSIAHALLYIPFGYWLGRGFKKYWLIRLLILMLAIFSVEIMQLLLARGSLSIQDLIVDVAGGFIGMITAGIGNIIEDRRVRRRSS